MIKLDNKIELEQLRNKISKFWDLSGKKILNIEKVYDHSKGSPVFTIDGKYTTRGWTEWTQGFEYGASLLQFDATDINEYLEIGRANTVKLMSPHISHVGVHDHGFNNLSTYGNLLRLMREGKIPQNEWEQNFYELAIKTSGAVQASRWTNTLDGGYIYSFNGPHSLFVDTVRTIRIVVISHLLGHSLKAENDKNIDLLERAMIHAKSTADYSVYYGEGRDSYDEWGRTAHESVFNTNDGNYRCPNSQQGYSGYTTWTRGLAWAMLGFSEELELLEKLPGHKNIGKFTKEEVISFSLKAAKATCDFYIKNTPVDGVPYWDTGAPNLYKLGDYLSRPADPFNVFEPVDSSAAAIGAQGLLRLGRFLQKKEPELAGKYWQSGITVLNTLLGEPYLSTKEDHQGILLHSIYHQPNGWDHKPEKGKVAFGESSMWGDYHMRELVLYADKILKEEKYYTFFGCINNDNLVTNDI